MPSISDPQLKEVVAAWEGFRQGGGVIGEINGLLVDDEVLEHEGHVDLLKEENSARTATTERWAGEQETAVERVSCAVCVLSAACR